MDFVVRDARIADMADIFRVRTSVKENHLSEAQLAELGVSPASLTRSMTDGRIEAWCAETDGQVTGFSMIDTGEREVFALFVVPEAEGTGIGSALLAAAVQRLFAIARRPIRLSTGRDSRARRFYEHRGWRVTGVKPERGDVVMTLNPPGCVVREARADDREQIVQLMTGLALFDLPDWRSADEIAAADVHLFDRYIDTTTNSRIGVFVAELPDVESLAGVVIGQVRTDYFTGQPTLHVEVLVVAGDAQGKGVGRALMDRAERYASGADAAAVTLTVFHRNSNARKVYERLGYEPEFVQYRKGIDRTES